jgi:3-methyladenine DNA glycosylase AlkC
MEPFKNEFSTEKAGRIAKAVKRVHPAFSVPRFSKGLAEELEPLELKQRMQCIAKRLEAGLPSEPAVLFGILVKTLAVDESDVKGLRGFLVWPLTEIVANQGLDHFPEAMSALAEMTQRFTGEFAIRPFLRQDLPRCMAQLDEWCSHPNEHVRRLVSEGSRPLLPWGGKLPMLMQAPFPTLALLEKLHRDPSDYVRLSVSNHLNDFSKQHPELVVDMLRRWCDNAPGDERLLKLARHACRTLLKAGHPAALDFHGYRSAETLELLECRLGEVTVALGGHLTYELVVRSASKQPLRVMFDYAIHHRKANGTQSPKVFKGRICELDAGETWKISGKHSFKPITTRVYHPGLHGFEPRLNGRVFPRSEFTLEL